MVANKLCCKDCDNHLFITDENLPKVQSMVDNKELLLTGCAALNEFSKVSGIFMGLISHSFDHVIEYGSFIIEHKNVAVVSQVLDRSEV